MSVPSWSDPRDTRASSLTIGHARPRARTGDQHLSAQFFKAVEVTKDLSVPFKLRHICELNALKIAKENNMYASDDDLDKEDEIKAGSTGLGGLEK